MNLSHSIPASLRRHEPAARDAGLLVLRLALALVFAYHGSQKLLGLFGGGGIAGTAAMFEQIGLPLPTLNAVAAGAAELGAAVLLVVGPGTRLGGLLIAAVMAVAIVTVHSSAFSNMAGGMEYPLTLLLAGVTLALTGPGRLTVARLLPGPARRADPAPAAVA